LTPGQEFRDFNLVKLLLDPESSDCSDTTTQKNTFTGIQEIEVHDHSNKKESSIDSPEPFINDLLKIDVVQKSKKYIGFLLMDEIKNLHDFNEDAALI